MNTRKFSRVQEERVAKLVGGKVVANSGATAFHKGDVVTNNLLIECKTTTQPKTQVTIKKDWLVKNSQEAFSTRKDYNLLAFDFGDGNDYFIIDKKLLKLLLEKISEEN